MIQIVVLYLNVRNCVTVGYQRLGSRYCEVLVLTGCRGMGRLHDLTIVL